MLVYLFRAARKIQYAWLTVDGSTLSIFDDDPRGMLTSRKTFATPAEASAALTAFVARREKAGWAVHLRLESPWIAWINQLEVLWSRVVEDARAAGVAVSTSETPLPGRMRSQFAHGSPSSIPPDPAASEYAELERVGRPRLHFVIGDDRLSFDTQFQVGTRVGPSFQPVFWRRIDSGQITDHGVLDGDVLESRIGDDVIRHASAEAFRQWFPRYVRDDVMGFTIAELAR